MSKKIVSLILCLIMLIPMWTLTASAGFIDVPEKSWYTESVNWCTEKGYFTGTSANTFSPDMVFSRAQFVTVLAKVDAADLSAYAGKSEFTDVPQGKWYTASVNWAFKSEIVAGKGNGKFAPDDPVTRQEACVILIAYLKYKRLNLKYIADAKDYLDAGNISAWAQKAVALSTRYGLVAGDTSGNFNPKGNCLRSMAAVMIKNFVTGFDTATKVEDPIVVAYYNASLANNKEELKYVDVINYHPAHVYARNDPFILDNYSQFAPSLREATKEINPDLKIVFTVANNNLETFEACLYPYDKLYAFGDAMLKRVVDYGFDGIDIDYEFPTSTSLRSNFVMLMKYLREKLDAISLSNGKEYILSMAVPGGAWAFDLFDLNELSKYVSYFNIMNYDTYVNRGYALHHTSPYDNAILPGGSVASDIQLYLSRGIPSDKIVPGCGLYSRRWTNVEAGENHGLYMPGTIDNNSYIHYSELKGSYIGPNGTGVNGYVRYWDDNAKAPYLYNESAKVFLSYDDEESVSYKADLVKDAGIRGIMIFDFCTCDYLGFFEKLDGMLEEK